MKKIYFPKCDFVITLTVTLILIKTGGINLLNDAFWVFIIYIVALGFTNSNKSMIQKIDNKKASKRKLFKRKHLDNPKSNIKTLPHDLVELDSGFNYDSCFAALKLVIGLLVIIILATITSIGHKQNTQFGEFVFYFYIDAFIFPLTLILVESFMYKQNAIQAVKEFIGIVFYKNEKLNIIRGLIGVFGGVFLFSIALIFTMKEFVAQQYGIITRIIIFTCGVLFLIYSFYNAIKQD